MVPLMALTGLVSLPVPAQGTWSDYQRTWARGSSGRSPWTLLIRQDQATSSLLRQDENLALMTAGADLGIEFLNKTAADRLAAVRNWGSESRWLLLDDQAERALEGKGTPTGQELRAFMQSSGYTLAWDRQDAFLREHPDHGEVLNARLLTCIRLVRNRFRIQVDQGKARAVDLGQRVPGKLLQDPSISSTVADEMYQELAEALERVLRLPDWWRFASSNLQLALRSFDGGASPRMREVLRRMRGLALEEWQRNPHLAQASGEHDWVGDRTRFGSIWVMCEQILEGGRIRALPTMNPSPGRIWPPPSWVMEAQEHYEFSKDWEGQLAFLEMLPRDYPEAPFTAKDWEDFLGLRVQVALRTALALGQMGRWDEVRNSLQEARRWAGAHWDRERLRTYFADPRELKDGKDPVGFWPRPVAPPEVLDLLGSPPLPSLPMPPFPPPIRLVLRGKPAWAGAWEALKASQELAVWGPDELRWEAASREDEALLSQAGQPQFEWAALREGSGVVAAGQGQPTPGFLAARLTDGGPSRLQRLAKFLREHPQHLDARQDRIRLILKRMPQPVLEPLLAEDAARAGISPEFGSVKGWTPSLAIWQPKAMQVVPDLEAALQRWPTSSGLWTAWIAWSAFLPRVPSVLALAERLPVFGDQVDWRGRLPGVVYDAVAREFRKKGQFEPMRAWFQEPWDNARKKVLGLLSEEEYQRLEFMYRALLEALTALKQPDQIIQLRRQWQELGRKLKR